MRVCLFTYQFKPIKPTDITSQKMKVALEVYAGIFLFHNIIKHQYLANMVDKGEL